MSTLRLSRRGLFGGFAALLAAPAIVRVASIMPVIPLPEPSNALLTPHDIWAEFHDRLVEEVSKHNAFMRHLRFGAENGPVTRYSGYDPLKVAT